MGRRARRARVRFSAYRMTDGERAATPIAFRDELLAIAASVTR